MEQYESEEGGQEQIEETVNVQVKEFGMWIYNFGPNHAKYSI